jgi:voltage-gated potassium channel
VDNLQHSPAQRVQTRRQVSNYLDLPSALAALLMVLLVALQFSGKVQPWQNPSAALLWVLWALFILEFLLKLLLSPDKRAYLHSNSHHALFALVPVLALGRLLDPARRLLVALIHLLLPTSPEAGPYIAALKKRSLGKLALVSCLVILIGGTLEYFFEAGAPGSPITSYGAAVWWSAATATTVANQLYPVTAGGEVVAFLMMVYAVCVFGYLASSLASVFIAGDAQQASQAGQSDQSGESGQPDQSDQCGEQPPAAADGTIHLNEREIEVLRSILARLEQR